MPRKFSTPVLILFSFLCFSFTGHNDKSSGENFLRKMHAQFKGKWFKSFQFSQRNEFYKGDTLNNTSVWYEAIVFPYDFRITVGEPEKGNAMIQTKDSVFNFRKSKLVRKGLKGEDLTFLLGGMYFVPADTMLAGIKAQGYDYTKSFETDYAGRKTIVIGANNADEKASTFWVDKKLMYPVRFIKHPAKGPSFEGRFGEHKQFGKARYETYCEFYEDGRLIQKEFYFDCVPNANVDMRLFDTKNFYAGK